MRDVTDEANEDEQHAKGPKTRIYIEVSGPDVEEANRAHVRVSRRQPIDVDDAATIAELFEEAIETLAVELADENDQQQARSRLEGWRPYDKHLWSGRLLFHWITRHQRAPGTEPEMPENAGERAEAVYSQYAATAWLEYEQCVQALNALENRAPTPIDRHGNKLETRYAIGLGNRPPWATTIADAG